MKLQHLITHVCMPEDQNQNTPNNNGFDTQPQGFSTDPSQQYVDPNYSAASPAVDPNFNAGYSTDFVDPAPNAGFDPYAPSATPADPSAVTPQDYQTFGQERTPVSTLPPLDQQFPNPTPTPSTFAQKQTGSKVFLYGSIAIVVVLLIAMGVLSYFNFFAPKNQKASDQTAVVDSNTSSTTDKPAETKPEETDKKEDEVIVDNGSTGGADTPASKARANSDTEIPKDWLVKNFTRADVDIEGKCINSSVCGKQADPDNDGASNLVEYNFSTDPLSNDTDSDLIADGDELFTYFTSPKIKLSDSDSFPDGAEIAGCYDPNSAASAKLSTQRRSQIASNVSLTQLHEPTISLLKDAGATQSDIVNRGVPISACPAATETSPNTTTTPTTSTKPAAT
jgi:hypothetical protein